MYEDEAEALYFGEVLRQVMQDPWLPEGAEVWYRSGKSRRGWRPTLRGILPNRVTEDQSFLRQGFSLCAAAWRELPWDTPYDPPCDNRWGRDYWYKEKQDRGVKCSYYDLYMRYCLRYWLDNACIPPANYKLKPDPVILQRVLCNTEYEIGFSNKCGQISLISGPGTFSDPIWKSPACGSQGTLGFQDNNGAYGCLNFAFSPAHWCTDFIWPAINPGWIDPATSKTIYVEGGVPPYHWVVAGTGFSLAHSHTNTPSNTLHAGPGACGTAQVLVTDFCGNKTTGYPKSTQGQWNTTVKWIRYKYSAPCADPEANCTDESGWWIPTPKVQALDCKGDLLFEDAKCSGASCSGSLCRCVPGQGFSYPDKCEEVKQYCDGYHWEPYGKLYWGKDTDAAPDLNPDTQCWIC